MPPGISHQNFFLCMILLLRLEKGPYGSENPFQNHSPWFVYGYALCSHLLLPLQNTDHIISICFLIGHPQEAINFMEKSYFAFNYPLAECLTHGRLQLRVDE